MSFQRTAIFAFILCGCAGPQSKGDFGAAMTRYESAIRKNDLDGATVAAEIARDADSSRPEPYVALYTLYKASGKRELAFNMLLEGFAKAQMPEDAIPELYEIATRPIVVMASPQGKKAAIGSRGFTDQATREKILKVFQSKPRESLQFAELFVDQGNAGEAQAFIAPIKVPEDLEWQNLYLRSRIYYLLGADDDFEKAYSQALKNPPQDGRRLFELGKTGVLAGSDENAEQFLLLAQKKVSPENSALKMKIDSALKFPERLLNENGGN
jgi:tetratricopeptide (TPR) repeat protein